MAKSTKKNVKKVEEPELVLTPHIETYNPCEWMIQFDNDEPYVLATSDENTPNAEVTIKINNTNTGHITFTDPKTGKKFKIFTRKKVV